jgi:phosphatidate cytidylyltransferase
MIEYLLPYLLLMAHFVSGAFWLLRINRGLDMGEDQKQWIKFGIYLLLVNLVWFCLVCFPDMFPFIGWIVLLMTSAEWWRATRNLDKKIWFILAFLLVSVGFAGFLYMDKNILLFTYFVVVLFDGSCQVAGQLLGKRALLPRISPRKTWEGLVGGTLVTLGTTLLTRKSFSLEWGELLFTTTVIVAAAFTGDMLASAVKRKAKITTFGKTIPGHGGVLDRFDSLIMAGALLFLLSFIQKWTG